MGAGFTQWAVHEEFHCNGCRVSHSGLFMRSSTAMGAGFHTVGCL